MSSNCYWFIMLCVCWDTPSERTGLWQLPKVSSVSNVSTIQFAWTKIKNHFCLLIFSKENNVTSWNIVPSIVFCPVNHILSRQVNLTQLAKKEEKKLSNCLHPYRVHLPTQQVQSLFGVFSLWDDIVTLFHHACGLLLKMVM